MIGLIKKRHVGPGWIVMSELGNSTGGNVSRHADAVAIGLWPSHGYAIHGYECKASRGDLQKELKDPRKADAVGKFCDHWWLVVENLSILEGLVLPETWGVLAPKNSVLRVVKKAPKLPAIEPTRGFVAAMIRNVTGSWVSRAEYNQLRETAHVQAREQIERARLANQADTEAQLAALKKMIAIFEEKSGIRLHPYDAGLLGEAVRVVLDARSVGQQALRRNIDSLQHSVRHHEHLAAVAAASAAELSKLLVEDPA